MTELAYIVLMGSIQIVLQSHVKVIFVGFIIEYLVMTFENGTFYRIESLQIVSDLSLEILFKMV